MKALRIRQLTFKYPHRPPLLKNLSATFKAGTVTLITGRSGTGKSTLLKLIARLKPLRKPNQGLVLYGDRPVSQIHDQQLSDYVAMMFQDPNRQFAMRTVKHELIFTLENRQVPAEQIPSRIHRILKDNRLIRFKDRKLATLSGGEKQRVALAIITALDSKVILLDEPFTNVDFDSRQRILKKLVSLKRAGKIVIIVDHDLCGYREITDQLLILKDRRLSTGRFQDLLTRSVHYSWRLPKASLPAIYQLRDFTVGYRSPLIKSTDLNFFARHATLITGPNGSGKSTLFRALLRLVQFQGSIIYRDQPLKRVKLRNYYRHVNLVFQEAANQFLEITVRQEIHSVMQNPVHRFYSQATVDRWLRVTNLNRHLGQSIYSLSGGQQKALQIIEALINGAPVLLMDEPFQSLDLQMIQFFKRLLNYAVKHDRRTLLVISHQVAAVADLFDYHVRLSNHTLRYQRGLNP